MQTRRTGRPRRIASGSGPQGHARPGWLLGLRLWSLAALLLVAPPADSARIEGIEFPEQLSVGGASLALRGTALLRYKLVFRGYVAALYLDPSTGLDEVLANTARRLEIEYFWSIGASDFRKATLHGIRKNVDAARWERLQPAIARFNELYRDVAAGDRYQLTYLPGTGTELAFNGEPLGRVEGADFSQALFSIWLGEEPFDRSLKSQLLGAEERRR